MKSIKKGQRNILKNFIQNDNKNLNKVANLTQNNSLLFNKQKETIFSSYNKQKNNIKKKINNMNSMLNINRTDLKSHKINTYLYHNSSYKCSNNFIKRISTNNSNINNTLFENEEKNKWIYIRNNLFKQKNLERNKKIKFSKIKKLRISPEKKNSFQNLSLSLKISKNNFYYKKSSLRANNIVNNIKQKWSNKIENTNSIYFSKNFFNSFNNSNNKLKCDLKKEKKNEKSIKKNSNKNTVLKKDFSNLKKEMISNKMNNSIKIRQKKNNINLKEIKPNTKKLTKITKPHKKLIFKNENAILSPLNSEKKLEIKKKEHIKKKLKINLNKYNINNNNSYMHTINNDKHEFYPNKFTEILNKNKVYIKTVKVPKIKEKLFFHTSLDSNEKDTQDFESKFINYDLGKSDKLSTINSNCYKNVSNENFVIEYETPREVFQKYAFQFINDSSQKHKNKKKTFLNCISRNNKMK